MTTQQTGKNRGKKLNSYTGDSVMRKRVIRRIIIKIICIGLSTELQHIFSKNKSNKHKVTTRIYNEYL